MRGIEHAQLRQPRQRILGQANVAIFNKGFIALIQKQAENIILAVKMMIKRAGGHAGQLADVLHRQIVIAVIVHQGTRRVIKRLLRPLRANLLRRAENCIIHVV